jgi:glycosyltransferase involved in cell wall biosynthesis
MKIAIVTKDFPPKIRGGGEISAYNLAQALADRSVEVYVITSTDVKYLAGSRFTLQPIIKTRKLPGILHYFSRNEIFYRESFKALSKFLSDNRDVDVIHAMNMASIPGTIKAARRYDIPSVITINSHWLTCPTGMMLKPNDAICDGVCSIFKTAHCYSTSPLPEKLLGTFYSPLQRRTRRKYALRADAVVSISRSLEKYVNQIINPKRSFVIPNIITAEHYEVEPEERYRSTLLFLGALIKPKGCEYLLRAMPEIAKDEPEVMVRILGEGPEYQNLRFLSSRLGLDKSIIFEGLVPYEKTPVYYASTDIVVFPSIWPEPFGRIAVEAMAAGKPVVGSHVGGIAETIKEGYTGILVEPGNSKQIADAVVRLLNDPALRRTMGARGKTEAKNHYAAEIIARRYLDVYRSVV